MKFSLVKLFVIFACILLAVTALSSYMETRADDSKAIPFSHKTHVEGYNIKDCGTCHKYNSYGVFQGLPSVGECVACHRGNGDLFTDARKANPRKKTMFDSYADKDRPWPSKVKDSQIFYYSHKAAVNTKITDDTTKVRCDLCHSDKAVSGSNAMTKGEMLMKQCIY